MRQLTLYDLILYDALAKIANYGKDNVNYPFVRAFHIELIHIAEEALKSLNTSSPAPEGSGECLPKTQPSSST